MPEFADYHYWQNTTIVHPVGLALLLACAVWMFLGPRGHALLVMFIMACFAARQRVVLGSFDFDFLRLMTLVGMLRVAVKSEAVGLRWRPLDTAVVMWAASGMIIYLIQQDFDTSAIIYKMGAVFDILGMYLMGRVFIRSWRDLDAFTRGAALVAIPVAAAFIVEQITARNMFAVFGGVPEITKVRDGRLRAQGAFAHPILAGTFWAAMIPLFATQWWVRPRGRLFAMIGVVASLVIIVSCASSTPVMSVAVAITGAALYPMRKNMGFVVASVIAMLTVLHFAMEKPVWHLMARIDIVGGSTGWHRYHLIDEAINHLHEWWLLGTESTLHWGEGLFDITNQYVLEGVRGGLVTVIIFIWTIVRAFHSVGRIRRVQRDRGREWHAWAVGVVLFVHAVSFLAVSYFGQIIFLWYAALGWTASLDESSTVSLAKSRQANRAHRNYPTNTTPSRIARGAAL